MPIACWSTVYKPWCSRWVQCSSDTHAHETVMWRGLLWAILHTVHVWVRGPSWCCNHLQCMWCSCHSHILGAQHFMHVLHIIALQDWCHYTCDYLILILTAKVKVKYNKMIILISCYLCISCIVFSFMCSIVLIPLLCAAEDPRMQQGHSPVPLHHSASLYMWLQQTEGTTHVTFSCMAGVMSCCVTLCMQCVSALLCNPHAYYVHHTGIIMCDLYHRARPVSHSSTSHDKYIVLYSVSPTLNRVFTWLYRGSM